MGKMARKIMRAMERKDRKRIRKISGRKRRIRKTK